MKQEPLSDPLTTSQRESKRERGGFQYALPDVWPLFQMLVFAVFIYLPDPLRGDPRGELWGQSSVCIWMYGHIPHSPYVHTHHHHHHNPSLWPIRLHIELRYLKISPVKKGGKILALCGGGIKRESDEEAMDQTSRSPLDFYRTLHWKADLFFSFCSSTTDCTDTHTHTTVMKVYVHIPVPYVSVMFWFHCL